MVLQHAAPSHTSWCVVYSCPLSLPIVLHPVYHPCIVPQSWIGQSKSISSVTAGGGGSQPVPPATVSLHFIITGLTRFASGADLSLSAGGKVKTLLLKMS